MKLKQFIFALVAMLSCFGFTANAQVAKVGNTEYATIDEAIANWTNGTTLTLLADVTLSDVIKLSSTEHHILDLGTYTMTAGVKKNSVLGYTYETKLDAIEIVCNRRSSASYALTVNADAANPGGITANGKSCVYYKKSGSTKDRPIILINNGVFNGSNSINSISNGNTNCPQIWINGGVFNGNVNLTKNLLQITGGTFHGSINCTGDVNAYRLISGGRFKNWQFMTNDNKNGSYDKFGIATSKDNYLNGNYNVGVYIDAEGYLVVGGAVIKELSPKYKAVVSYDNFKTTDQYNNFYYYLAQSSAATYGLFYEDAEMAIKKHGAANVTVWEKPAVTIPENVTGDANVVEEIKNNTALNDYTPENLPAGAELEIVLESVGETFVYDVTPMKNGAEVEPTEAITFRLPVPASVTNAYAKVYHEGTLMGLYTIKGEGNAKYVEISSANFSVYTVEPTTPVAKIGETAYATLSAAFAAVTNDNQTVVICKDVTENLTATLRGNITTENGAKVTITLTNSDWVYCPYTFVLGENVTMKVPALFYYAGGAQINGTLVVGAYYQCYAGTKLTINEPGSMTVTSETCIIRYMDGDANAGIYVVGDNNNETIGLKLSVAYFYQGMINAKDANIVAGTYWQTNDTDSQGSANLFLDNSTLNVTVNEHDFKATGNSTVTLQNNSSINVAGGFVAGDNTTLNVDATSSINDKNGVVAIPAAKIGTTKYATLDEAFAAATADQTITLLADAIPALTSQRAITKAAVVDLDGKTLTLTEDDLYFGTTTFKNGTIVVDPSVKPSTAVFWMFANQTLTFDNVKIVATGVTGTYLIGLDGDNSDLNLLNGSEILVENTTALDLDIICVNASTGNDIKVENSKVNVTNLDGRVFFRGNYTVKDSEVNLAGITKAGFRIEAGQTLSIEGTSKVIIEGEPRDGGIHLTDFTATYTKEETADVTATVNEPKVAKIGENTYRTLAQAVAAVEDGGTIILIANETFTKTNRTHNSGTWYDGLYYVGDKSFTIDLGGFTISQDGAVNDYLLNFKNSGSKANTITLKNGTIDAGTAAFCAICTSSSQANELTINTEDINIINNISNGSTIKLRGGAVLNVKDGTKITGKNSYLGIECVASTVNIYDGAEIYMNGTSSYNGCLVGACGGGTVNVYGGYGKGAKGGFIAMTSGGTINVEGGEWIANTNGTVGNNSNVYVLTAQSNKNEQGFVGPAIINVTGGAFRGGMDAWVLNNHKDEKAELNISGGNFNANPTKYVEDDYIAVENNGVWNVVRAAAKIGETYYATLAEAIAASTPETGWGGEVTLLKDVTLEGGYADADEGLRIEKSVTINGAGYTIDCGKFTKGIRIYQNGDLATNVMFKHTNIVNNNYQGRCIDTRSGKINLMFNGGVNLTAHGTNSQPLTIGGSEAMTKVTISGGTIDAGTSGYAVICFVPVTNHINVQGNAVIKGLAAFYLKEGVTNTAIKLSQSTSIGTNKYAAASGDFGAIVIEGSNNGVCLEHSGAVVKAVAADGAEMAAQAAFLLRGNNNTVGYYNNANAQVLTEGGQAYWTLSNADVTGTKYERNGVEMLLEAETRGYQFITVEDALRYAKNGDTVKLLANAELDETYVNEKSLTLDLNGKTLSTAYVAGSTTNHLYAIQNNAELTITDSSDAKDGKISTRGNFNYGTLTLEAGTIEAIDGNGGYAVRNYAGSFTMNGGTIATTLEDDHQVNNGGYDATTVRVDEGATFTMNGGVINNICDYTFAIENYGTTTVKGGKATSVHTTVANYGTINIEGGKFVCNGIEGITAHAVWAAEGTTNISGGTFDGKYNYNGFNVCASKGANVVITGGNFLDVHSGSLYGDGTITVSGGTFFDKISDQRCELGFQPVVNTEGTYDVKLTNKREAYTIVDGDMTEFVNEKNIEVGTLTYKRELYDDLLWNALFVPFEIPVTTLTDLGLEVVYFNDVHSYDDDNNGTIDRMTMESIKLTSGTLQANHPYMFRRTSNAAVTDLNLTLYDATLYSSNEESLMTVGCSSAYTTFEIGGTYKQMSFDDLNGRLIINEDGNWKPMGEEYTLNPFRLHLTITQKNGSPVKIEESAMRAISIRVIGEGNGSTTDIKYYDVDKQDSEAIYDLQGRRVANPVKGGIYIVNGKKVYYSK